MIRRSGNYSVFLLVCMCFDGHLLLYSQESVIKSRVPLSFLKLTREKTLLGGRFATHLSGQKDLKNVYFYPVENSLIVDKDKDRLFCH